MFFATPSDERDRTPYGQGEEYEHRTEGDRLYDLEHDARIIDWRVESFLALGFDVLNAAVLAVRKEVDREHVQRLIGAGATPEQVTQIVL